MRKLVLLSVLLATFSLQGISQFQYGLEAGPLMSTLNINQQMNLFGLDLGFNSDYKVGFYAGPTATYDLTEQWYVRGGAFFALRQGSVSQQILGQRLDVTFRNSAVEVPIQTGVRVPLENQNLLLFTGPSLNFNLEQSFDIEVVGFNISDVTNVFNPSNIKTTDLSWKFGAGLQWDRIAVLGQYSLGLTDVSKSGVYDANIHYFSLGVNVALN